MTLTLVDFEDSHVGDPAEGFKWQVLAGPQPYSEMRIGKARASRRLGPMAGGDSRSPVQSCAWTCCAGMILAIASLPSGIGVFRHSTNWSTTSSPSRRSCAVIGVEVPGAILSVPGPAILDTPPTARCRLSMWDARTAVGKGGRVVGAIGPLEVMVGAARLLPAYLDKTHLPHIVAAATGGPCGAPP